MEIKRDSYLNQLVNARQNGFIKVVTGPRRCGKSYLLKILFKPWRNEKGILMMGLMDFLLNKNSLEI